MFQDVFSENLVTFFELFEANRRVFFPRMIVPAGRIAPQAQGAVSGLPRCPQGTGVFHFGRVKSLMLKPRVLKAFFWRGKNSRLWREQKFLAVD